MNALDLGLIFIITGLVFFGVVRLLAQTAPKMRPMPEGDLSKSPAGNGDEAVLVIEAGGRVRSLNARAREVFQLREDETPDLERLVRHARPVDAFMMLCAGQGRARFVLNGRFAEGSSYALTFQQEKLVLVSLRFPELTGLTEGGEQGLSSQTLQTFTELTRAMAASLDLEKTLTAVLEGVEKIVPADYLEIGVWDSEIRRFVFFQLNWVSSSERRLEQDPVVGTPGEGYTGYLFQERSPLLVSDVSRRMDVRPAEGRMPGMRSFLGLPLMAEGEFVGTLELGSRVVGAFREEDLGLIRLLGEQAALAIRNALLFREEKKRSSELSRLSQLTQAFGSMRDPKSLFARLVENVAQLIRVHVAGFLLYHETQRILEAQVPFYGLPDQIVELYRVNVGINSPLENALLEQDVLLSEDASADTLWENLGLAFVAQAASLHETVLVPLQSGGRMLGYLQVSNRVEGGSFTQSELNLLMIVANQVASIIENALLVQQSRQRAQRAEALRQIVSLTSSAANLDEILQFSVQELARLLRAEVGAVFLMDQARTMLSLHRVSFFGPPVEIPERATRLQVDDAQFPFTITESQEVLRVGLISDEVPIIPFYRHLLNMWKVRSVLAVPLVVRGFGVGELWFGNSGEDAFDALDVQLVATAAGQLAGAVEQIFLREQTDESLRRRVEQLISITRISRELSNSLDLDTTLKVIHSEAVRITGADCGSILFFDPKQPEEGLPVVRRVYGDAHSGELTALELRALETLQGVREEDFEREGITPPHAGVRSGLAVPILIRQVLGGVISLHGLRPGQFDENALEMAQSLAVQAAVALRNAVQFEDESRRSALLRRELDTLAELLEVSRFLRPDLPLEESLVAIGGAIRQATPFQVNVISVYEPSDGTLRRVCATGLTLEQWEELKSHVQPWESLRSLLRPEFRVGNVYFIPADRSPSIPADVHVLEFEQPTTDLGKDAWNPEDFLLVPLYDSAGNPLGLISVDMPSDGRRPDRPTFEALEIFGVQAGLMIESHRRVSMLEDRLSELEGERERLTQAAEAARLNMPVLLRRDLDHTLELQDLNRRIERIRASLEIAAQANAQDDAFAVLRTLAQGLLTRFALQVALIAERTPSGVRLIEVLGAVPEGCNVEALFGQRNPLRHLLQTGAEQGNALLVASLDASPDWHQSALLNGLEAKSFVGLYLPGRSGKRYGVLVVGRRTLGAFSEEDRRIFEQLARQVSTGLQNLQLLEETRRRLEEVNYLLDFSLKLSTLKPEEIFRSLVESVREVLPQAQAGWVGLFDAERAVITPQVASGYVDNEAALKTTYSLVSTTGLLGDTPRLLMLRVLRTGEPVRVAEVDFPTQYHLSPEDLLNYRQATRGRLPISCMMLPLRLADKVSGVLVLENFEQPDAFHEDDEALAYSFTQQAGLALENARLYQTVEMRATQLQNLTQTSSRLTSSLQREELVSQLLDLLGRVVPYDTATLWLREGNLLTVFSACGFEDDQSRLGISAAVEDSLLFREMIQSGAPIAVKDVRSDARFPSLVPPDRLSWLGIPLIVKGEVIGLIACEKKEAGFYTDEYLQVATTFAGQAAVALENARLFEESVRRAAELDQRSQRLALLNRLSGELGQSLDIPYILRATGEHLREALRADVVAFVLVSPDAETSLELEQPVQPGESLPVVLRDVPLLRHLKDTQGIFNSDHLAEEADLGGWYDDYFKKRGIQSLLIVPLIAANTLHGWILLQKRETYRFAVAEIELARTVANQAAIAIQNARLFEETRSLTEFLEKRVEERTSELRREHQNSQTLLRVISELSTSLDMDLVLNRALGVINESLGSHESLAFMLQSNGKSFRAGENLVATWESAGRKVALEREITMLVAKNRKALLLSDVLADSRWQIPAEETPTYRSVLAVPIIMGEEVLGALLLLHREVNYFHENQIPLAEATARQIGIAINNAELFNLIRDQSEHLGKMLREQQIEASRSRALLEAIADGVLVTDGDGKITLFNASAERILDLRAQEVIGRSLEQFSGLFGRSGANWVRTIRNWSKEPKSYGGEFFADQFDLDNGKVIAVHLAPVFWRSQFLGTVSIFRDITHEVQVDRMKSEFVANVSHELRTPMTSIKGYVEIMLLGATGELTPQQRHFLEIVKNNTERLGVLVNDLLDLSRIESGKITLNMTDLNLRLLAEEVMEYVSRRSQEEEKPMNFSLEVEENLPTVRGDEERIRQVITNLVVNGYNYTPENGHVWVRIFRNDGEVQVDVQDDGIGISIEDQERIFERFYRGEDPLVLKTAGTGLGLAVAKTIVTMHNGRIWFKSSGIRGEGSTFSFTLPLNPVE